MPATSDKIVPPIRRRRWFQFSIGSLLILTLACGVLFAFVAHYRREFEREKSAIAAIQEIAGKCETAPRGPAWLRWLAGEKSSTRVVAVDLAYREVAHGLLPQGAISYFSLRERVTDEWLSHLEPLKHLENLNLSGNPLSEEGLKVLRHLTRLRTLDLSDYAIDDRGMVHLESLSELRTLDLSATALTNDGLQHLSGLTKLEELNIGRWHTWEPQDPRVTEEGFTYLESLANLRRLRVTDVSVSDVGIRALAALPALTELDFSRSSVAKSGLNAIPRLPSLRILHLNEARQEAEFEEIRQLQIACPNLTILGLEGPFVLGPLGLLSRDTAPLPQPPRPPEPTAWGEETAYPKPPPPKRPLLPKAP